MYYAWDFQEEDHNIVCLCSLQAKKESQVTNLQQRIKSQQSETSKAKSKLETALENTEKMKKDFSAERAGCDTEKASLLKRAEDAEAALKW